MDPPQKAESLKGFSKAFLKIYFVEVQLIYSAVIQIHIYSDTQIHTHTHIFGIEYNSLCYTVGLLGSFNGPDGTWWSRVDDKKVKERKRLRVPGLHRKPIKLLTQSSHHSRRHQALPRGGEGTERLLERVLEAQAGE